jgi:non-heme chloroperoxidase
MSSRFRTTVTTVTPLQTSDRHVCVAPAALTRDVFDGYLLTGRRKGEPVLKRNVATMFMTMTVLTLCLLPSRFMAAGQRATQAPDGFFRTSDGVRLHYLQKGSGRPIVFVPGWTMQGDIWAPQIQAFSSRYRTIALDPRAQGASEMTGEGLYLGRRAQDVGELIEHLGLSDVVLVGWSMGVREVLAYLAHAGTARVGAVALVEGNLWPQGELTDLLQNVRRMQADRVAFTKNFVRTMYVQPQTEAYLDAVTRVSLRTPTDAAAMLMIANAFGSDTDMRGILGKVDRPLLYVGVPSKRPQGEALKERLPSARIEYFEGAGHALFVDQAQKFNALLEDFIKTSRLN